MAEDVHIAQLNVARMRAPLDDPLMAGFVARLDEINALADSSPGFVWRLQTEAGDATGIRLDDDPSLVVNLSVWETLGTLRDFVYKTAHRELLKARTDWFETMDAPHLVLWPVAAGHLPDIAEASARRKELARTGPSQTVFTFATAPAALKA